MSATQPAARDRRRSRGGVLRWLRRFVVAGMALVVLALLIGALAPVPSTLMLWRSLNGEPVERNWVSLDAISPELRRAVIASEDQRYCSHHGVDWGALREVLSDEEGPSRGASTIPMQTVKNVYLWHGRSAVRKGIEIPLALAADFAWPKRRMMEVYLNVAEFGEGVFGAEAAARRYFGKSAAALTRREAAQLAATLPNPRLRNPSGPSARARANVTLILRRMEAIGDRAACVV